VKKSKKMVFLGAGNMAEALVRGVLKAGLCAAQGVTVTDVREERLVFFRDTLKVQGAKDNGRAVNGADVVVLSVKPQSLDDLLREVRGQLPGGALIVSIAAGITTGWIEARLSDGARVVRVMPNTPALVGCGVAAICGGRRATGSDLDGAEDIFKSVGRVIRVDEKQMDAVTAVSGSGPAYVFYLMEAMMKAAAELGLDPVMARELVVSTVAGSARLCDETKLDPAELRARVTSKGGTTAAAVDVLAAGGVGEKWVEAIKAAHRRARELAGG